MWATVFSGGICLFVAIAGKNIFSFICAGDAQYFNQIPEWLSKAIVAQRGQMQAADAFRSLIFILLGALAIFFFAKGKLPAKWFAPLLGVLIIADMWPVDRRYFNDSHFTSPRTFERQFALQPYEEIILQDKDPHFRVFNLSQPAFSENRTSYYLKSIGGYSAAKLRRYQDLIDEHLQYLHFPVVNMLNVKYLIGQGQDGQIVPQYNPDAMGNAWFVDEVMPVAGANAESDALMQADLRHIAVVDTTAFGSFVAGFSPSDQSDSDIVLTEYAPDRLEYDMDAANDGVAVFSEIYYPFGWKAYIDDVPAEHFRVNYVLRAMNVPKGKHHIKFEFRPDSVRKGDNVSMIFILIMLLSMAGFAAKGIYDLVKIREQ
ncbi:MAG: YfhO family protein [Bacteroidales bacterium]|nr:YfhO family protein [Bacteroidales bacterium]